MDAENKQGCWVCVAKWEERLESNLSTDFRPWYISVGITSEDWLSILNSPVALKWSPEPPLVAPANLS